MEDNSEDGLSSKLSRGSLAELLRTQIPPASGKNIFQVTAIRQLKQAVGENGESSSNDEVSRYRVKFFDGADSFESAVIVRHPDRLILEEMPKMGCIVKVLSPDEEVAAGVEERNRVREVNGRVVWVIYNIQEYNGQDSSPSRMLATPANKGASSQYPLAGGTDGPGPSSTSTPSTSAPVKTKRASEDGNSSSVQSVKRALFNDDRDGTGETSSLPRGATHRIKDLNPYQNKFRIEGLVVQKSPLRTWSNSRGQGQVFDVTIRDASGDIKVAAFNEVAAKFCEEFVEGSLYSVEAATIKPVQNRRFNNTTHDYELFLHGGSKVSRRAGGPGANGHGAVLALHYNFTKVSEVVESTPAKEKVDILAVVVSVNEATTVSTRFKSDTLKKDITVLDDSGESAEGSIIAATLWDDMAGKLTSGDALNKVVAFKGALVSDWQGKSLSCGKTCAIQIEPEIEEARKLKAWYEEKFGSNWAGRQGNGLHNERLLRQSSSGSPVILSLQEVKEMTSTSGLIAGGQQLFFTVEAAIVSLKLDKLMYMACSNPSCRRKVVDVSSAGTGKKFRCEKCNISSDGFDWRYIVQATIADITDYHFVTLFDEAAETVLRIKATELAALHTSATAGSESRYQNQINGCKFKLFRFKLRAKVESYNDEQRLKLTTIDVSPVDRKDPERLARIKAEIKALEEELNGSP